MTDAELLADCHTLAGLRFGEMYSINEYDKPEGKYYVLYRYNYHGKDDLIQTKLHGTYSLCNLRTHIRLNYFY